MGGEWRERRAAMSCRIYTQHHKMTLTVSGFRNSSEVVLCSVVLRCHAICCLFALALACADALLSDCAVSLQHNSRPEVSFYAEGHARMRQRFVFSERVFFFFFRTVTG